MATIARHSIPQPQCCCGSDDCAYLVHNGKLLDGLEHNVSRAAQLGKALLVRHEAYVADSERERRHMSATIESLEKEKFELENRNAQSIKANRDLLDQLEQLNDAVADSDAQIRLLTDTLHSTEEELERLSSLAARTQALERQLIDLELEQAQLQGTLKDKVGDERTAIQRWKRAETTIGDLQDQIDRIEKEAREERERHLEIVARMERRVAVNRELATAAERLKAQAGQEKSGSGVVSHFVKDILLDNSNLQHGIVELREMLTCSNEEVELLREQLRAHQPVPPATDEVSAPTSLQKELGNDYVFNPELHIHHHYHNAPRKEAPVKVQTQRRPRKKRYSLTFTSPAPLDPSTSSTILSQTAVTVPQSVNRWSNGTTLAPSSVPGSPLSTSYRGSVYDRVFSDVAYDSSRPTSPSDSVDPGSPAFGPSKAFSSLYSQDLGYRHQRRKSQGLKPPSLSTIRSTSTPISLTAKSSPATAVISAISPANSFANDQFTLSPYLHTTIPEENEDHPSPNTDFLTLPKSSYNHDEDLSSTSPYRSSLRRAASHESLISVSGMDIHTLQSRPAQLLFSSTPKFSSVGSGASLNPEVTPWTATAAGNLAGRNVGGSNVNRELLYSTIANQKRGVGSKKSADGLGKKVGDWVFGKWGVSPNPTATTSSSSSVNRPSSSNSGTSQSTQGSKPKKDDTASAAAKRDKEMRLRPAGVNQSGPIWGFFDAIPETPTKVVVENFDEGALVEALGDG